MKCREMGKCKEFCFESRMHPSTGYLPVPGDSSSQSKVSHVAAIHGSGTVACEHASPFQTECGSVPASLALPHLKGDMKQARKSTSPGVNRFKFKAKFSSFLAV